MGSIKEYCEQACLRKTEPPKHEGYAFVKNLVTTDKFLRAKHLFWISIAQEFEPFLTLYQADRPLIPFLASDLDNLLRNLMVRFVKDDIMASSTSYLKLASIDISSEDNCKSAKLIDVGIATKRELENLRREEKATQKEILEFRIQCKTFLVKSVEKMLDKCPLKYLLVRCMRCLDPCVMAESVTVSVKLFGRVLNCLIDAKRVKDMDADRLKREYQQFLTETVHGNPQTLLKFKNYDKIKDERVDSLLASLLKESNFRKLWELVKCLLVLSHGQASVERGFSVNKEMMQQNFKERSVTAQRIIYDHIKKCGGVMKVTIDQELRNAARQASSNYRTEQRKQQEAEKKKEKEDANKALNDEISVLQAKRRRIIEDSVVLKDSIEKLMDRAEKEQNLHHVTKANSFKRTIKDMERETDELDATLNELQKKLKR